MDLSAFLQAIVLLAVGSTLTLVTSSITERRADRRLDEDRRARGVEARRLDGIRHVETAIKMLDDIESHAEKQMFSSSNSAPFELDAALMRRFENEVSLVPDSDFRKGMDSGIGLLIGVQELLEKRGLDSSTMTLTLAKAFQRMRDLGAAYLRGEAAPPEAAEWLSQTGDEVEDEFNRPIPPVPSGT
jgi:hypothetical protein